MDDQEDLAMPLIREEVHADAVPVVTGGVRVTKRIETHDEIIQQELRKSHVDVKRVSVNRIVDGLSLCSAWETHSSFPSSRKS